MTKNYLDKAYGLETQADTDAFYGDWAASYDTEIAENGYATPARTAAALWRFRPQAQTPVLDYGCGTGLSGLALRGAGFERIDGTDPSPEMLAGARAKNAYRHLTPLDVTNPAPITAGHYAIIAAIGVIGVGAAPLTTFDLLMHALPAGGVLGFSFNDHALADPSYEAKVSEWVDTGHARLLFREYGDHLPGVGLKSNVYVIERS